MITKKVRPVIIDTNEKSNIYKIKRTNKIGFVSGEYSEDLEQFKQTIIETQNQHLYLISLEPIEYYSNGKQDAILNELIYDKSCNLIGNITHIGSSFNFKATVQFPYDVDLHKNRHCTSDCYKVIATQEQLSPEYIQQFISQYNLNAVKDIEIEMEYIPGGRIAGSPDIHTPGYGLQSKLVNGHIVIVEEDINDSIVPCINFHTSASISYSEEEVKEICINLYSDICADGTGDTGVNIDKWWNNNKKK